MSVKKADLRKMFNEFKCEMQIKSHFICTKYRFTKRGQKNTVQLQPLLKDMKL